MVNRGNNEKRSQKDFRGDKKMPEEYRQVLDLFSSATADFYAYKSRLEWLEQENQRLRGSIQDLEKRQQEFEQRFDQKFDLLAGEQVRMAGEAHQNPANVYTHVRPSEQHIALQKAFVLLRDTHFENAALTLTQTLISARQLQIMPKVLKASFLASLAHHLLNEQVEQDQKDPKQQEQVLSLINAALSDVISELGDQAEQLNGQGQKLTIAREIMDNVARLIVNAAQFRRNLAASSPTGELHWYPQGTPLNVREHRVAGSDGEENSERRIARTLIPAYLVGEIVMGEALVQLQPLEHLKEERK